MEESVIDTVVVVYTSTGGLINTMKKKLSAALPDCRIVNIADNSLIKEVMEHDRVMDGMRGYMMHYFQAATRWDPRVVINACSSVGEVAEAVDKILSVLVIRIDKAMIRKALQHGDRVGVAASLATTMEPTASCIRHLASDMGRNVRMISRMAQEAYETNSQGRPEFHDDLIKKEAEVITGKVDVLTLAQGSTAGIEASLKKGTGLPVYASPCLRVREVQKICEVSR